MIGLPCIAERRTGNRLVSLCAALLVLVFLVPGCGIRGDFPYLTAWDSTTDPSPPDGFMFVTLVDSAAPVRVERFVLTTWAEWTSKDPEIGVWIGGEEVPVGRQWRVPDLSGVEADAYAASLNELIDQWGEAKSPWREAQVAVESGGSYSLTMVTHDGDRTRFTWRVRDGLVEPLREEHLDKGAMIAQGMLAVGIAAVIILGLLVAAIAALIIGIVLWRKSKRRRTSHAE